MTFQSDRAWLCVKPKRHFGFSSGHLDDKGADQRRPVAVSGEADSVSLGVGEAMGAIGDAAERARGSGQSDFFNVRLDLIVDMGHPRARLAATIDCRCLEERFEESIRTSRVNRSCREG